MDLFGFEAPALSAPVRRYFSGVAAPAIWAGYADAGVPMCLVAAKLPAEGIRRAMSFVDGGGDLLLDSGAFVHREHPEALDWAAILSTYGQITQAGPVTLVLPDVVGDQAATLQLLRTHAAALRHLAVHPHITTLLPLQAGALPLHRFYSQAVALLGFVPGGIALPSHAAALPPASLRELAHLQDQPRRVHFLGVSRNAAKLGDRLLRLSEVWPDAQVSADACEHRAQVGQTKPITRRRAAALVELLDDARVNHDETEDDEATVFARDSLAEQFPDLDDDELSDVLCSSWGSTLAHEHRYQQQIKTLGPAATRISIREFAQQQTASRTQPDRQTSTASQKPLSRNNGLTHRAPSRSRLDDSPKHSHENHPPHRIRLAPVGPATRHAVPAPDR